MMLVKRAHNDEIMSQKTWFGKGLSPNVWRYAITCTELNDLGIKIKKNQENVYDNIVCKIPPIFFKLQCVNQ